MMIHDDTKVQNQLRLHKHIYKIWKSGNTRFNTAILLTHQQGLHLNTLF